MSDLKHKAGVKAQYLVTRHIKLEQLDVYYLNQAIGELKNLSGVDTVSFDYKSKQLKVAYDATHCQFHSVRSVIEQHRLSLAENWWSRVKAGYYSFVDRNIKDNAKHEPICCNKIPPGSRKR